MPDEAPSDPPFEEGHFRRVDESDDAKFYVEPRLVTHIDDAAIGRCESTTRSSCRSRVGCST